jgi:hypothetical protein
MAATPVYRDTESQAALGTLGVDDERIVFLGRGDGRIRDQSLPSHYRRVLKMIDAWIEDLRFMPQRIYAPSFDPAWRIQRGNVFRTSLANGGNMLHTCMMAHGLYLKANLEMPCWDDVGEQKILRTLDPALLSHGRERELSSFDSLLHIRDSFMQGRIPYPGLCERCAVLGNGKPVVSKRPTSLQVIHVEPSYLCHLACPQCIPPKLRRSLKTPPYHLDPTDFDGFLSCLKSDGVERIELVIFEGRGDPLNNKDMGELVRITKRHFPMAFTSITTHGNFPFRPWIMDCGLDLLRLSVDGAFQENYATYRVGGNLEKALALMRGIRDFTPVEVNRPSVEWKYILFEWNDSDEELSEAGRLASELRVTLRFCRTHTPGRSVRYVDASSVDDLIRRLAPEARPDLTFQLKSDAERSTVEVVRDDQVRARFSLAHDALSNGDVPAARRLADDAMLLDPMFQRPQTTLHLASFLGRLGKIDEKMTLLRRYLEMAPDAPDSERLQREIELYEALMAARAGDEDLANEKIGGALSGPLAFRSSWLDCLGEAASYDDPGVISALANIAHERGDAKAAGVLFQRYLELAPEAPDRDAICSVVDSLGRPATATARERVAAAPSSAVSPSA